MHTFPRLLNDLVDAARLSGAGWSGTKEGDGSPVTAKRGEDATPALPKTTFPRGSGLRAISGMALDSALLLGRGQERGVGSGRFWRGLDEGTRRVLGGGAGQREITAMTTRGWFGTGASVGGGPVGGRAFGRQSVMLVVLAAATLSQTGCKSGCGTCGLGQRLGNGVRGVSERVFRPFRHGAAMAAPCCGGEMGTLSPGAPFGSGTVVSPSPMGSMLPGVSESMPNGLEAIPSEAKPSAVPGPPPGTIETPSQGAKSPNGKANYEAFRPKYGDAQARGNAITRSSRGSTEPTPRSAQGSAPSAAAEANPLDNLPPIELPEDVTRGGSPPVAPAVEKDAKVSSAPGPAPAAESLAEVAAAKPTGEVTVAPGIRRIAGVESKLAGGSLPTDSGLDWLAEKGYRTILDLRESGEATPAFIADVTKRGMRYIALPISAKTVDTDHVTRFQFEISLSDARPLYFFDGDGTRAGTMWYLRRVMVDKVDPQVAKRDAEELGLTDPTFWAAANAFLEKAKTAAVEPAPVPAGQSAPKAKGANGGSAALETTRGIKTY